MPELTTFDAHGEFDMLEGCEWDEAGLLTLS